ncbi:amino acid ABC transporter permease [Elioraea sp.]|uniref:amino acid ABC transporter permease n=1 Tax=Elioraea sp. TaxID=2185103 RepID=UPI0025BB37FF|nr:amino acid ABC transporter permease [Elioraea sp.]
MMTYRFRWDVVWSNAGFLLSGLELTLMISAMTLAIAIVLGLVIAVMQMSASRILRWIAIAVGEVVRNTPILVQLLWVYYVLPIVFDIEISAISACVIGLSVYASAFIAEAYRAGIQAVPRGHSEAAQVLGLTGVQTFLRIVLPQAIRFTLPPLCANFVLLIKYSSLGAVVSVSEITRKGMELSASTFRPLEIFTFIAVVYFFICWPLTMSIRAWERRLARR